METMMGQGRLAIDMIVDQDSFAENQIPNFSVPCEDYAPGAVVGTARINGRAPSLSHGCSGVSRARAASPGVTTGLGMTSTRARPAPIRELRSSATPWETAMTASARR